MDTSTIDTSSAPVSSSTESSATAAPETRPTFQQAFAPETATTDPATTAQGDPGTPPENRGPIPFDVHHKALENARTKAVEEALAKHRESFGWAEQVDRAAVEQGARLGQLYSQDRAGYIRNLLQEAAADPQFAPLVHSEAARILAGARGTKPPSFEPDIPVYDEQGRQVAATFSADKQRELITHMVAEALGKEVAPLKADLTTRQQHEQAEAFQKELHASVDSTYAEIQEFPGFKEHEADIAKVFATLNGPDPAADLRQAWKTVVVPKLSAQAKAEVLDSLKTKAAAASGVNPAGAVIATNKRPTSLTDPSLKW